MSEGENMIMCYRDCSFLVIACMYIQECANMANAHALGQKHLFQGL